MTGQILDVPAKSRRRDNESVSVVEKCRVRNTD